MNFFELNGARFGNGSVIAVKDVDIRNIIHSMKKALIFCITLCTLCACTPVLTNASDSDHVTYINTADTSIESLAKEASVYCQRYGKKAVYRERQELVAVIFDCKLADSESKK